MITTQAEFRTAIFDPELAIPASLTDGLEQPAGRRFNVYRNNVIVSLKDALSESFPVISKLIGPQNFANLAGLYVRSHPPSDPRMILYSAEFPAFLETFQPLQHVGYLADVARLELAQGYAYHAADATPINPAIFDDLAPDVLIARAEFDPVMLAMPAGSAELIALLQNHAKLGEALETIEQSHPDFDFSALLGLLLQTGALVALTPSQ